MRVLVTGRGYAASWTIRGEQIGHALGATVKPNATVADMRAHDVILVVKRVPDELLTALRHSGRPWVYDIVDAYPQREGAPLTYDQAIRWGRDWLAHLKPQDVIWPNERMLFDLAKYSPAAGHVVYHHARPGAPLNPIREKLAVIGYEGSVRYIERWQQHILAECQRRGLTFLINPSRLADCDVVLAVRDSRWRGYCTDKWKSNVKLANAQATGTPFFGHTESGYIETHSGAEYWVEEPREIARSLDWIETHTARMSIHTKMRAKGAEFRLERCAAQVREVLACAARS